RLLTSDDSQSLAGDGRLITTVPADGDYVVELSDSRYRGGTPAHYRLRIASEADVAEEVFPLGGRRGESVTFTLPGGSLAKPLTLTRKLDDTRPHIGRMRLDLDATRTSALPSLVAVGDLPEVVSLHKAGEKKETEVKPPLVINGRLEQPRQVDRFRFAA